MTEETQGAPIVFLARYLLDLGMVESEEEAILLSRSLANGEICELDRVPWDDPWTVTPATDHGGTFRLDRSEPPTDPDYAEAVLRLRGNWRTMHTLAALLNVRAHCGPPSSPAEIPRAGSGPIRRGNAPVTITLHTRLLRRTGEMEFTPGETASTLREVRLLLRAGAIILDVWQRPDTGCGYESVMTVDQAFSLLSATVREESAIIATLAAWLSEQGYTGSVRETLSHLYLRWKSTKSRVPHPVPDPALPPPPGFGLPPRKGVLN